MFPNIRCKYNVQITVLECIADSTADDTFMISYKPEIISIAKK